MIALNRHGLTFRDWFRIAVPDARCQPNAWGGCSSACPHEESASPELAQAWRKGECPHEWHYKLMLRRPSAAELAGQAFIADSCVVCGVLYHYHPGNYWLAFDPWRESMVRFAPQHTD